jgi:DNA processing protein
VDKDRVIRQIVLTLIPKVGSITARLLLNSLGGLEGIFGASVEALQNIEGITLKGATHIFESLKNKSLFVRAEKEVNYILDKGLKVLFIEDPLFPERLTQCSDSPILLFSDGNMNLNKEHIVSVVGSRNATAYGKKLTQEFIQSLQALNVLVVSGLAYGIDIASHRAALEMNLSTVGVLGHGLDTLYPSAHFETSKKMKQNGGLLTEFMTETKIQPIFFPRRNRIIAGLCDALIVVEASDKGGAVISAQLANSYDREVFAFPGRVGDTYSLGCLKLIQNHEAQLVMNGEEVLKFMNWGSRVVPQNSPETPLSIEETLILQFIRDQGKVSWDQFYEKFNSLVPNLQETLLNLEIQTKVRTLPGNLIELI